MIDYQIIEHEAYKDNRGKTQQLSNFSVDNSLIVPGKSFNVQSVLFSNSVYNTVRGLHYQEKPFDQIKVVTCIQGRVTAYVYNLQTHNHSEVQLTEGKTIIVNNHCAFGFKVLSCNASMLYLFNKSQEKSAERVVDIFSVIKYSSEFIISQRDSV